MISLGFSVSESVEGIVEKDGVWDNCSKVVVMRGLVVEIRSVASVLSDENAVVPEGRVVNSSVDVSTFERVEVTTEF